MITVQEAQKLGINVVGGEQITDFIFGATLTFKSGVNAQYRNRIDELINSKLAIKNYSKVLKHLTFVLIILDDTTLHPEQKICSRIHKHLYLYVRFPDYEAFCNADEKTALKIMAQQTLRGAEKFLSKVKDFDYQHFSVDLKEVLAEYL